MAADLKQLDSKLLFLYHEAKAVLPGLIVTCTHRNQKEQDAAYASKKSKLKFPNSKHNAIPAKAMDLAIVRKGLIDWDNTFDWGAISGVMLALSKVHGIPIRLGSDFNGDGDFSNDAFVDAPHVELK